MSALLEKLGGVIGREDLQVGEDALSELGRDICRFDLGIPVVLASPRSSEQVLQLVRAARELRIPIVPFGKRSAYWRPLCFEGAIALCTDRLVSVGEASADFTWCGAGTPVRTLHERFLEDGNVLGCHPDAFGDTSIGSMVATGFRSGCGMGTYELGDIVAGLRIVLGTGEVLQTGEGQNLGGVPFGVESYGDLTGAFFGSTGALGVVTEVALRPVPRPCRALLSFRAPAGRATAERVVGLAQRLAGAGFYETFRAVELKDQGKEEGFHVDLFIRGPEGVAQRKERVGEALEAITASLGDVHVSVEEEDAAGEERLPRWWGDPQEHWESAGRQRYSAVDVNLPYEEAQGCLDVFYDALPKAVAAGATSVRLGLYAAPSFMNIGMHVMYPSGPGERFSSVHPVADAAMRELAKLNVEPYGPGRAWEPHLGERSRPRTRARSLKTEFDPDGLLHPDAVF